MLCQPCAFAESFGSCGVIYLRPFIPALRLQRIDTILTGHQVGEASTNSFTHIPLFMFNVQRDNRFSCLQKVQDQQFHEIGLALTGVAQYQDVGRGFILISLVEIHHDVGPVLILTDVETIGICFAAVVERIEICHGAGREYSLELLSEGIVACGIR